MRVLGQHLTVRGGPWLQRQPRLVNWVQAVSTLCRLITGRMHRLSKRFMVVHAGCAFSPLHPCLPASRLIWTPPEGPLPKRLLSEAHRSYPYIARDSLCSPAYRADQAEPAAKAMAMRCVLLGALALAGVACALVLDETPSQASSAWATLIIPDPKYQPLLCGPRLGAPRPCAGVAASLDKDDAQRRSAVPSGCSCMVSGNLTVPVRSH